MALSPDDEGFEILDPELRQIKDERQDKIKKWEDMSLRELKQLGIRRKRGERKADICKRIEPYKPIPPNHLGKHLKLTPELIQKFELMANPQNKTQEELFFDAVNEGLPATLAVKAAGISPATYFRWKNEVEEDEANGTCRDPDLHKIIQLVEMIKARNALRHLKNINNIAMGEVPKGDARPLQWLLERTQADNFGVKKEKPVTVINLSGSDAISEAIKKADEYEARKKDEQTKPSDPEKIIDVEPSEE